MLIPLLLLLSGFCGISYEILYAKLLGNTLGNQFTINATVLLTFLLGIGLGTLHAHRLRDKLWAVEAAIGGYAALLAAGHDALDRFLYSSVPALGVNLYAGAALAFVVLAVPAFFIGCSVPLFASYLGALRQVRVFSVTYAVYNLGAALTALCLEFVLLRSLGLVRSTWLLAALNGVVALGLLALRRTVRPEAPPTWNPVPRRGRLALAVASVAAAVFQRWMIKLAEFVLGPFNETFSLVLATVLASLALASFLAGRWRWAFHHAVLLALGGTLAALLLFEPLAMLYAALHGSAVRFYAANAALKLGFVFLMMVVPATGFGATIPALLHQHRHVARESGQLLCWSSMANALGFLLMAFVLHRFLDYGSILVAVAFLAAAALVIERGWRAVPARWGLGLAALALPALALGWNEGLLYVGHTEFHSPKSLRAARSFSVDEQFKGPQDVFAITRKEGEAYFFINGYISIPLENPHEKYVGALSAMLAPRTDRALVLGVGSGATAGTVGLLFEHTDAVEINRVVLDHLQRMVPYSFDIESLPGVRIVHDDGLRFVKASTKRYSLILNTVTTPLYFSSSKLYTIDFLSHVAEHLTPDGVYTTWIDARIGDEGLGIVLESLGRTFRHAWLLYLKTGYFLLACSNEPLEFGQLEAVAGHARLRDYLAHEYAFPLRLLPYSLVSADALSLRSSERRVANTLDFPVLEFTMARGTGGGFGGLGRRLERDFDPAPLRQALEPFVRWDDAEAVFHACLRLQDDSPLRKLFLEGLLPARADHGALDRVALSLAQELGTVNVYYEFGRVLQRLQRHAAAAEAFTRALALDPALDNANYHLGEVLYELGRHEEALERLLAEWRMDRDADVPLRMAMSLDRRRRFGEALDWLAAAELLGPAADRKRVAFWRGVTFEGLGRRLEAEGQYMQALRADKEFAEARQALRALEP